MESHRALRFGKRTTENTTSTNVTNTTNELSTSWVIGNTERKGARTLHLNGSSFAESSSWDGTLLDKRDRLLADTKTFTAKTLTAKDARVMLKDTRVTAKDARVTNDSTLKTKRAAAAAQREGCWTTLQRAAALGETKTFTAENARVTN